MLHSHFVYLPKNKSVGWLLGFFFFRIMWEPDQRACEAERFKLWVLLLQLEKRAY